MNGAMTKALIATLIEALRDRERDVDVGDMLRLTHVLIERLDVEHARARGELP